MTYPTSRQKQPSKSNKRQAGVTLLLAILILASLLAITFSLSTVLFIEVRSSSDLLRTESSFYGATGVGEQAFFNLKRQVCLNNDPACLATKYTSNFSNNVSLSSTPSIASTSTPIFLDKVPVGATFSTTLNKYDFCDGTAKASGCGYGLVKVSYISTGTDQNSISAYLCEFDPNASPGTYQTLPPCSAVGQSQNYWKQPDAGNWQTDGSTQITASTNSSAAWTLDNTKQQQLIITAPTAAANVYFSVSTFGPGTLSASTPGDLNYNGHYYTPKGLPYVGQTAIVVNTNDGPVGRKVQVMVPSGSGSTGSGGSANGFAHHRIITVSTGQVPSTQTNFPVLVSISNDAALKSASNGGNVQSSSGTDIVFTSDAAGNSIIPYEQETYDATTGTLKYWVQLASISDGAQFYMFYGKAGATDQSNKSGVWDSNFKGVYHLPNGTTLTANDSTINAKNGTLTNGPTAITGQIDGGANLASASSQYITMGNNLDIGATDFTISYWINAPNANQFGPVAAKLDTAAGNVSYSTGVGFVASSGAPTSSKKIYLAIYDGVNLTSAHSQFYHTTNDVVDGNWHYITVTRTSGTIAIYVDGTSATLTADIASNNQINVSNIGPFDIGWDQFEPSKYNGKVDEVRVSTTFARPADWIRTEYNNQSNPGSFETVSAEQTP